MPGSRFIEDLLEFYFEEEKAKDMKDQTERVQELMQFSEEVTTLCKKYDVGLYADGGNGGVELVDGEADFEGEYLAFGTCINISATKASYFPDFSSPEVVIAPAQSKKPKINPGVRRLAHLLTSKGFEITDSGDGKTHDFACDRDYPYVVIRCTGRSLKETADRLLLIMVSNGVDIYRLGMENPSIQATYDPADATGTVELLYVDDETLSQGQHQLNNGHP